MEMEIFYPNKLKKEDILKLSGWKLKAATLHYGKYRGDCIDIGYGYAMIPEDIWDDTEYIHVVSDKSGTHKPISLKTEIDWDNPRDLLAECGMNLEDILKDYIVSKL